MKAIVYTKYGSPDVLELREVEKPAPGENEVLIKVQASSVNSWDWGLLEGRPLWYRLFSGFPKPKHTILGCDIAGVIEAVGTNVKNFQPGDAVFGDINACGWGGFAEYVCVRENALALKSPGMTFEQAAAIPQAGVLALQSLRDKKEIKAGQTVLINGAGGGVGTFAIQMAKLFGAEVTAVDSSSKLEMMRSLGADYVIDYRQEDFSKNGKQYDLIIDVVANRSIFEYKRSLKPKGVFVLVGGTTSALFQTLLLGSTISMVGNRKLGILMHRPNKNLEYLKELFESGKIVPVIDRCYPLHEVAAALRYFGDGDVRGKIVISLEQDTKT